MRTVAARAEISQSLLSKVENGQLLPSLNTVYALAGALGVPASSLLPTTTEDCRPLNLQPSEGTGAPHAELLAGGAGLPLQAYRFVSGAGDRDEGPYVHEGLEFVYVLRGRILLHRGTSILGLAAGQHISYDSSVAHWWETAEDAEYLLVVSP